MCFEERLFICSKLGKGATSEYLFSSGVGVHSILVLHVVARCL